MDLKSLLPKEHVHVGVFGEGVRSITASLAQLLDRDHIFGDMNAFVNDVEEREKLISTQAPGTCVAFPHARSQHVNRLALALGISEREIVFSPQAEKGSRVFFLIAVPAFAPTAHMPILKKLAKFSRRRDCLEKLFAAKTPAKAARVLTQFKG